MSLKPEDHDRYLIQDTQRVIQAIVTLVRIHSVQGEGIFDDATGAKVRGRFGITGSKAE